MSEPKADPDEQEIQYGLKQVIRNGVAGQALGTMTGGVFLMAYALNLGISNAAIGLLTVLPPLIQIMQVPAVYLIKKIRKRKLIYATGCTTNCLLMMAAVPNVSAGRRPRPQK